MQAVSSVTHIEFSKVKIGFDCTMVIVSTITCLAILHINITFLENKYCLKGLFMISSSIYSNLPAI